MSAVAATALSLWPKVEDQWVNVLLHIVKSWVYISAQRPVVARFSWFSSIPPSQLAEQYIKLHHDSFLQHKKRNVVRVQAMKSYKGHGGIALLILKLCTRRRSVVTANPGRFTPEEAPPPRCSLNRRLDGSQSRSGCFGKDKKYLSLAEIRTPDRPARRTVTIPSVVSPTPLSSTPFPISCSPIALPFDNSLSY
jgi:hypothetical protein